VIEGGEQGRAIATDEVRVGNPALSGSGEPGLLGAAFIAVDLLGLTVYPEPLGGNNPGKWPGFLDSMGKRLS